MNEGWRRGLPRAAVLVLLAGACAHGPEAVGPDTGDETAGGEVAELAREPLGETALVARAADSPMIDLRVVFDAGSAADPEGLEGLTNLTARLMAEGGAGELTYAELTRRLYPMAARITARAGRDQTVFVGRVHRDHLDHFYEVFRAVLLEPRMDPEDFRRIKEQVRTALELELRGNDDEELGKESLQAMLYEGHPFGHPVLGTEQGLENIALEDAREQRRRVFCGGRAVVGVAGGYPEGFAARVRDDLASRKSEHCVGRRALPAPPEVGEPRIWLVDKGEAASVAISMGMHVDVTPAHPDYPALVLATAYLGQHRTFVGKLMQEMRGERGLNYGDYAYAEHFDQDGWSRFPLPNIARRQQYLSLWIRPVKVENAHFALRMAVRALKQFIDEGLTQQDFDRVRTFVDRYYALYLQTESRRLGFAIDDWFYGVEGEWLARLRSAWADLTVEEVNEAIARHLDPDRLQIALVHPDGEAFADRLASEEPSSIEYAADPSEEVLAEDREIAPYRLGIPRGRMRIIPVEQMFAR